jgi:pyruvate/2-oxoglutarate dehydrogenase complex dihydrolipoamide dehydrogenase (E3) component
VHIEADNVVIAIGFEYYRNIPPGIVSNLSSKYYGHSCDVVTFDFLRDKRCLILGGRQAAFEWAALSFEHGCKEVVMVFDHDLPLFERSDWSWIDPLIKNLLENAGWFSSLSIEEREHIQNDFWKEGRLKLEPWLGDRLAGKNLKVYPNDAIDKIEEKQSWLNVHTQSGEEFAVDYLILATGYKIDLGKIPFLRDGNLAGRINTQKEFPELNAKFESNIPGLYFTSFASMASFGPFCGFIKGAPLSAKIIVEGIVNAHIG